MKKRLTGIFILFLFVFVQLANVIVVKAEEPFSVEVVVEGNQGELAHGTSTKKNAKEALIEVLTAANVPLEQYTEGTSKGMIKKIGTLENTADWSKYWMTAINRSSKYAPVNYGIEQLELQNKDRFLVYYSGFATVPANKITYSTNKPNQSLIIGINNIGYTGQVSPITNINTKIDGNVVKLNEQGQIIIEAGMPAGKHTLEINDYKTNAADMPQVLADKFEFTLSTDPISSANDGLQPYERDNRAVVKNIDNEISKSSVFLASTSDAWIALSMNKLGIKPDISFVKASAAELHKSSIKDFSNTELEKLIIGLTAAGYSPYNFEKHNLVEELYNRNIDEFLVNDIIFALIARNYANITGSYKITNEILVQKLLSKKLTYTVDFVGKTGWTLSGKAADPDITAMAISSLAPFYSTDKAVKTAVDNAVLTISGMENESGYILNNNGTAIEVTSETLASVILALTSVSVNPEGVQFANTKGDLVSALLSFRAADGQYKHTLEGSADKIATEQALRAAIAIKEFRTKGIYNFYSSSIDAAKLPEFVITEKELLDLGVLPQTGSPIDFSMITAAGLLLIAAGTVVLKTRRTKA